SASHPSGFCSSTACCARHEVISSSQPASWASTVEARILESGTAISGCPGAIASEVIASANAHAVHSAGTAFFGSVVIAIVSVSCAINPKRYPARRAGILLRHLQEHHSVLWHFRGVGVLHCAEVLALP